MISHCSFNLHISDVEQLFMFLLTIFSMENKKNVQFSCTFFNWIFFFKKR